MAGAMRKVGEYLGLVEQADYDEELDALEPTGTAGAVNHPAPVARIDERRSENRGRTQSAIQTGDTRIPRIHDRQGYSGHSDVGLDGRSAGIQSVSDLTRIETVTPRTYNDARTVGEQFRDGVPVIMNLSEIDDSDAKRLVDFAAGLVFAVHGTLNRVTGKVFLLSPSSVVVTDEDKQRIAAGGFYNQS